MTVADDRLGRSSLRTLLHAALDLPVEERRDFVAARLPAGVELADALALLDGVDEVGGFLETPLVGEREVFRPALPARIGRFEVERLLGFGSMGVVYLARQAEPARHVALKLLRLDQSGASMLERFRREADVLARLAHPGIAQVYDAGVADLGAGEQPWFAMEFVDGVDLLSFTAERGLDRRARVRLLVDVARAVQHAHEQGVVHRDLKPENVLVRADGATPAGRACVLDFGVAQLASDGDVLATLTQTGQLVGTLSYMAPEQSRGGAVDARADQYALGVMLYELLTGELPLDVRGRLIHDALRVVADALWTPPSRRDPTLAGDLEAILGTALAPEPNRRYASVGAFADDLDRWLAGRAVVARPPARLEGVARIVRRHPLATLAAMLVLAVLAGFLAFARQARLDQRLASSLAMLFADRALYDGLLADLDRLWPADSARVPLLDAWLTDARALAARIEPHRAALASFAAAGRGAVSATQGEIAVDWLEQQGSGLVAALETLASEGGPLDEMEARRTAAARLFDATVTSRRAEWSDAAARLRRDPRFPGFDLAPQEGLVPLGRDPNSGLEEFAAYATGALPTRDAETGPVRPREGDALTFVLVPGGERWIGCQGTDPNGPNYVTEIEPFHARGDPCRVQLRPFLIAKFELTQDAWLRICGANPSYNVIGKTFYGVTTTPLHPVETMSWMQLIELLPRFGMTLPTEAQWEVAARGGTPFAYVWGDTYRCLAGHANTYTATDSSQLAEPLLPDDGISGHAPVGSFLPNAYGLYDVLGNVWEYCLDPYKVDYHELEHRVGDGLVLAESTDGGVSRRGPDFALDPVQCYVFARSDKLSHAGDGLTGVRPLWLMKDGPLVPPR